MKTLPSLDNLADISQTLHQSEASGLTSDKIRQVINTLTPEERAIWERLAPAILNPDFYIIDTDSPGGGCWMG